MSRLEGRGEVVRSLMVSDVVGDGGVERLAGRKVELLA